MTDTTDHKVKPYSPSAEYRYFLYDPNDGYTFYRTPEERDIAAKSLIKNCLVDGEWSEQVVDIFAGEETHRVTEIERIDKVGELDEDGYDENGEYWEDSDIECKCNYALQPLAQPAPVESAEPAELTDEELLQITAQAQIYRFRATAGDPVQYEPTGAQLLAAFRAAIAADTEARLLAAFRAVIAADRARRATPPAEGEVGKLVAKLRRLALQNPLGTADPSITRAAALIEQQAAELAIVYCEPTYWLPATALPVPGQGEI